MVKLVLNYHLFKFQYETWESIMNCSFPTPEEVI